MHDLGTNVGISEGMGNWGTSGGIGRLANRLEEQQSNQRKDHQKKGERGMRGQRREWGTSRRTGEPANWGGLLCDEELQPPVSPLEEELQQAESPGRLRAVEDELAAKSLAVEELSRELEDIRAAFGAEGVQQLQDFEAALKQRDGIITQLTANLQQARMEKDEVMREFLQLTEQSQKLQLQFQQLQAGESLRSSSISSTAADLLQSRQQVLLYQQQLEQRDMQLDERDPVSPQVTRESEESINLNLQIEEQEKLLLLSELQDNLRASESHLTEVGEQLAAKIRELEACEVELQTSRQKERLSSGEIQQLMGTVEDLQKRCHHQGAEQGDAARKADLLRAELDEMYGQQIVQMKQELLLRHTEEMAQVRDQHSAEMEKISENLRARLTQSTGEVNALNARVVELQQKLQENQVLREKAVQDLAQVSKDKLSLQNQVQELAEDLRLTKQSRAMDKSQTEIQQELQATISDLQAKLAAAREASKEMEAKHESEITNYQIKLEMLEREKDAVLDRMAESQESELERLRTHLLFSHEEELSRLRDDLQHESQMNMENLRDELRQVRNGYEAERSILDAERSSLLQEIVLLKDDLSRALESSRVEELVLQLKEMQVEIQELKTRESERSKSKEEESWDKTRVDNLESENKVLKEANAAVEEELKSLKEDREGLLKKIESLATDNQKASKLAEDLRAEIERQKSTFSFAEKNFEVNYQELREELEEKLQEQMRQYDTRIQTLQEKQQSEDQGGDREQLEEEGKEGEVDEGTLVEKDTTELMEKLQKVELEKVDLEETLQQKEIELQRMEADLKKVELEKAEVLNLNRAELQRQEMEKAKLVENMEESEAKLQRVEVEKAELMKLLEDKELGSEKTGVVDQAEEKEEELCVLREEVKELTLKNEALEKELEALQQKHLKSEGVCSVQDHHLQITAIKSEFMHLLAFSKSKPPVLFFSSWS
uniref:A-kinase anchoring protein 9 n=1 Tax=Astyanax mexicanus TaxID=7994 RepID=A0A8B9GUQ0_ASTMX